MLNICDQVRIRISTLCCKFPCSTFHPRFAGAKGFDVVQYVGVENMVRLVRSVGIETFLIGLAEYIEMISGAGPLSRKPLVWRAIRGRRDRTDADARRRALRLQVRQRPPEEHDMRPADGDGLRRSLGRRTGYPCLLSEMTIMTALADGRDLRRRRKVSGPTRRPVMAIIGLGAQSEFQALAFRALLGISNCGCSISTPAARQVPGEPRRHGSRDRFVAKTAEEAVRAPTSSRR